MDAVRRFRVREGTDASRVLSDVEHRARLRGGVSLERDAPVRFDRVVYETFDWRFLSADSVLEHRRASDGATLLWRSLSTGELLGQVPVDEVPSFVWHLPNAPVVERLARITDVRALVPLLEMTTALESLRLVDDEGKTLARLSLDRTVVGEKELPGILELTPVRGYGAETDELADVLAAQVSLTPEPDDPVLVGLRAAGFAPGSYSSKLRLALDGSATAFEAWTAVLRALFATMQANEAGLRDDVDSEFLHDFRVAVRRTRSVLADAKGVLDVDVRRWAREEFRWLGQATSPARDADVFVLSMPEFESALPEGRRQDLKHFQSFLEEHRRQTHDALIAALDSDRAQALFDRWRGVIDVDGSAPDAVDATAPAADVAGNRIAKAHRRVVRAGRRIDSGSHPEELHELRKDAKRLRYLLECFGSLFPGEVVAPVVRDLKGLQDVLGDYQDTQVQAEAIEQFGQQMIEHGGAPAAALLAMGSLVEHLHARGREARAHFAERFDAFDAPRVRRNMELIARGGEPDEGRRREARG